MCPSALHPPHLHPHWPRCSSSWDICRFVASGNSLFNWSAGICALLTSPADTGDSHWELPCSGLCHHAGLGGRWTRTGAPGTLTSFDLRCFVFPPVGRWSFTSSISPHPCRGKESWGSHCNAATDQLFCLLGVCSLLSGLFFFFFSFFKDLLIYFWPCWVFIALHGLFSRCGKLGCPGFSRGRCLMQSTGSRHIGFGSWGSAALEQALSSCGEQAWLPCSRWGLSRTGAEPASLVLAGRFFPTGPPGRSCSLLLNIRPNHQPFAAVSRRTAPAAWVSNNRWETWWLRAVTSLPLSDRPPGRSDKRCRPGLPNWRWDPDTPSLAPHVLSMPLPPT